MVVAAVPCVTSPLPPKLWPPPTDSTVALAAVLLLPTSTVRISPSARSLSSMLSSFFVISAFAKSSVTLSSPAVKLLPPMPPGALPLGASGGWLSVLPLWLSGFAGG